MTDIEDVMSLFPSKYVAASDLRGQDVLVTISNVNIEELGKEKDIKPVIYFQGMSKGMVLNKTNTKRIVKLYGPRTRDWLGRQITLYPTETPNKSGEIVDCIRVRENMPPLNTTQAFTPPVLETQASQIPWAPANQQVKQNPTQPAAAGVTF